MEFDFNPKFEAWDAQKQPAPQNQQVQAQPQAPVQQPKAVIETFDVDNAFIGYKPSFETTIERTEAKMPAEVPPIDSLEGTVAAQIFGAYCENKFGFKLVLNKTQ